MGLIRAYLMPEPCDLPPWSVNSDSNLLEILQCSGLPRARYAYAGRHSETKLAGTVAPCFDLPSATDGNPGTPARAAAHLSFYPSLPTGSDEDALAHMLHLRGRCGYGASRPRRPAIPTPAIGVDAFRQRDETPAREHNALDQPGGIGGATEPRHISHGKDTEPACGDKILDRLKTADRFVSDQNIARGGMPIRSRASRQRRS